MVLTRGLCAPTPVSGGRAPKTSLTIQVGHRPYCNTFNK